MLVADDELDMGYVGVAPVLAQAGIWQQGTLRTLSHSNLADISYGADWGDSQTESYVVEREPVRGTCHDHEHVPGRAVCARTGSGNIIGILTRVACVAGIRSIHRLQHHDESAYGQ